MDRVLGLAIDLDRAVVVVFGYREIKDFFTSIDLSDDSSYAEDGARNMG